MDNATLKRSGMRDPGVRLTDWAHKTGLRERAELAGGAIAVTVLTAVAEMGMSEILSCALGGRPKAETIFKAGVGGTAFVVGMTMAAGKLKKNPSP